MCSPYKNAIKLAVGLLAGGMLAAQGARAESPVDTLPETVQVHGFASQTLIHTTDNRFFGESDDGVSTDFRELGVNATWRAHPNLTLAGQLLSRSAGEGDQGELRLDYGFAHYNRVLGEQGQWSLLAGKTKLPYGLYNDTRDVAFTRPSILLPQSIYFDRSRDLVMGITGAQLQASWALGSGEIRAQIASGQSEVDDKNIEYAFFLADRPGGFKSRGTLGVKLEYELEGGQTLLALGYGNLKMRYDGRNDPLFGQGDIELEPCVLSAQWNGERLSLTGEVARQKRVLQGFSFAPVNMTRHSLAYYLQATYRLSRDWSVMLRRDVFYGDEDDRHGSALPIPHLGFSKDWTLGTQYQLNRDWMLAAEWHRVNGTFLLPLADNPNLGALKPDWDMLLLQVSYRF